MQKHNQYQGRFRHYSKILLYQLSLRFKAMQSRKQDEETWCLFKTNVKTGD